MDLPLLLYKAPQNAWKYFKVIWKSQGILFCLTCGNPVGKRSQVGLKETEIFARNVFLFCPGTLFRFTMSAELLLHTKSTQKAK